MSHNQQPIEVFIREMKVVAHPTHTTFNETVNRYLSEGWRVHGTVTRAKSEEYTVVLVKYDEKFMSVINKTMEIAGAQLMQLM